MDKIRKLKRMRIFKDFSEEELARTAKAAVEKIFPAGACIVEEGEPGQGLFLVESGEVEICKDAGDPGGGREFIAKIGPGDHFGEMSLLDGQPASASVVARVPTICFVFKVDKYEDLLSENPVIAMKLYRFFSVSLCERLRKTDAYFTKELLKKKKAATSSYLFAGTV